MNVNVEVDDQIVMQHLENMTDRLRTQLEVLGNATGQKIQQYAQENAPWTDRTGAARERLKYNSDIDGFGRYAAKYFVTLQDWDNYNWLDNFQNSTFNVSKTYNCALRLWLQETGNNQNALMNKSFSGLIKVNSVYRK